MKIYYAVKADTLYIQLDDGTVSYWEKDIKGWLSTFWPYLLSNTSSLFELIYDSEEVQ